LGIATTVRIATASDSQQFIGPVRADHNRHNWTRDSSAYHDTEEDRANTGIGHCTTLELRGSTNIQTTMVRIGTSLPLVLRQPLRSTEISDTVLQIKNIKSRVIVIMLVKFTQELE
jgi:hypothetical protein